jgi:hypothetical protein
LLLGDRHLVFYRDRELVVLFLLVVFQGDDS